MLLTAKLFSAGCHSHKELFHEGGRKKKKCSSLTNNAEKTQTMATITQPQKQRNHTQQGKREKSTLLF